MDTPPKFGTLLVVCWHHGNIPSIAHALKAKSGTYPDPWYSSVFNLILNFEFAGGVPEVTQVKEHF